MNRNDHIPEPRALFHRFLFENPSFSVSFDDLELQLFNQGIAENRSIWACICDPSGHVTRPSTKTGADTTVKNQDPIILCSPQHAPFTQMRSQPAMRGFWCYVSRGLTNFNSEAAKSIRGVEYCIRVATAALSRLQDISGRSFVPLGI